MASRESITRRITVEVVLALSDKQALISVSLPAGASVADAIAKSSIAKHFTGLDIDNLAAGIWGRRVDRNAVVSDGDRVEMYRELEIDPRDARRQLALAGRTMSQTDDD